MSAKKLRRELELSKKECSELAREAARIRLDSNVARTREMDRLQSSLKSESKFADQSSPIGRRDDRTVTETPRAAAADTYVPRPSAHCAPQAYDDDDDGVRSCDDEAAADTRLKDRLDVTTE